MEWFGFVAQWLPSGSHSGTPSTVGTRGLYQKRASGPEGAESKNGEYIKTELQIKSKIFRINNLR